MLKRLLSPILKPFAALVADEINQVHSDEISKRLDSMTAELRQIASHLALSAIYDGRPELTFKELLGDVDFPELWKDHLFRLKHQKLIDTVTDEVVNIVWHAKELSVDKGLAILVRNYESAIGKRAYCLSRIILYWVGQQFYCPNFDVRKYIDYFHDEALAWSGFQFTWAEIIAFLAENSEEEAALKLLWEHRKKHDLQTIDEYLPAAHFAHKQGLSNDLIKQSHDLYSMFLSASNTEALANLFSGNTSLAVVGNGPYELGSGNGTAIDAHDLVLRFNWRPSQGDYTADYGGKTDIWATHDFFLAGEQVKHNPPPGFNRTSHIIAIHSPWEFRYSSHFVQELLSWADLGKQILCFSKKDRLWFCQNYPQVKVPTSGLLMLIAIKRHRPHLTQDHIYGFSFKTDISDRRRIPHYYSDEVLRKEVGEERWRSHDMHVERNMLRDLFMGQE